MNSNSLENHTRYRADEDGYEIIAGGEFFNRILYGSHVNDHRPERYFAFAGDQPLFAGAVVDWTKGPYGGFAKNGYLMSGLALTPGMITPSHSSEDIDVTSHWLHDSEDVVATFRRGWMEYDVGQFSPWFPFVNVKMTALPLMGDDGLLVHYEITTDQRVIFCLGFGGLNPDLRRFEFPRLKTRFLSAADCQGNRVTVGENRAKIEGNDGTTLWVGTSFSAEIDVGDAATLASRPPSIFLKNDPADDAPRVARIARAISPGETLKGLVVIVRDPDEAVLDKWLRDADPVRTVKGRILKKLSTVSIRVPDAMLNASVPPTVVALDATWHENSFHHGATIYHCPYLGWRSWYGPTVIGWHDRVETTIKAHLAGIVPKPDDAEEVWYDGENRDDLDHEGTQYHQIKNSHGYVPCLMGSHDIYNMQEVGIDMLLHHLQWTGDLDLAKEIFESVASVLDWEERILDPDGDGLYQNFLNTWISDGHSYNGAGCAQSSCYNYHANRLMGLVAAKIGQSPDVFERRAETIKVAILATLWMPGEGLLAECVDTIGNKLLHPSPELSTLYLAVDCGVLDDFQAYQALRFTETELRNERTHARGGRQVHSSNWYPRKYSTCGLFPAENLHLALAYFKIGQSDKAMDLLNGVVDSFSTGKNPGMCQHVLTARGVGDCGCRDFTDVTSLHLLTLIEGLFGIRFRLLEDVIEIAPGFPADWTDASITLKDLSLNYYRDGDDENLEIHCDRNGLKRIKLPLRSTTVEGAFLNGEPVDYAVEPGVGSSRLVIETTAVGAIHLRVFHGTEPLPSLVGSEKTFSGEHLAIDVSKGRILDWRDPSEAFSEVVVTDRRLRATVAAETGQHTLFARIADGEFDAWLPFDFSVEALDDSASVPLATVQSNEFDPVDLTSLFNEPLAEIHTREFRSPRPEGYSIGVRLNGRYAWDWNQGGMNAVIIDDAGLRDCGGVYEIPSGIGFSTPAEGPNGVCVSMWDNYPTSVSIPLTGKARELAVFFVMTTNAMQCWVENARLTVNHADGPGEVVKLINPLNTDDWMTPALQAMNETVQFSDYNHGIVQRIPLDPGRELKELVVEAVANEVIMAVMGVAVAK